MCGYSWWGGGSKAVLVAAIAWHVVAPGSTRAESDPSLDGARLSLNVSNAPLAEVLAEIEKQTGNRLSDEREQFGQEATAKTASLKFDDEPFWPAVDRLLDEVKMSPYSFSGSESLALVDREPSALRRSGRAAYSGPFRIEPISVAAQRGVRAPEESRLQVELEIAWEPRLRILALAQRADELTAVCDDGLETPTLAEEILFDTEIKAGSQSTTVTIPLQLPAHRAKSLESLHGKFTALVPREMADLKFDQLASGNKMSHAKGGLTVSLDRVAKNQDVWEVHMRIAVEGAVPGLAAHLGWVFENQATLTDNEGNTIENAGFETTMQTDEGAGLAYFYELPQGTEIGDCTWVYRTPTMIESIEIEYKLEDVLLP